MYKKIQTLLIFCISASSFAAEGFDYDVKSNLTVENKTDVPMIIIADQPNNRNQINQQIPAHAIIQIITTSGDMNGKEYKMFAAPFTIKSDDANHKLYIQGRINYLIAPNSYNFMDALSVADGLTIDASYTCFQDRHFVDPVSGKYDPYFKNKIVISGMPGNELHASPFPAVAYCQGWKSSTLNDDHQFYEPKCYDGKTAIFQKYREFDIQGNNRVMQYYAKGHGYIDTEMPIESTTDVTKIKEVLDKYTSNILNFCGTFSKEIQVQP